ncbi:MAG: hypothetical protein AAF829_04190 [Pseudomonadota bacterium]
MAHQSLHPNRKTLKSLPSLTLLAWALGVAFVGTWLALALWANLDASAARHMLFMDELITFDGVQWIYDAESPAHAIRAAMENDQRYGRTTFYLSTLASTIGDVLAGEQGRIVFTRMAFALTLCAAICVLSWTMLETALGRALAIGAGLTVPMASYYATMPKPDPLMLLFLGLYVLSWKRNGHGLGLSMIWLGLGFGAKIAALPALIILLPLAALQTRLTGLNVNRALIKDSALGFLAGFLISVPIIVSRFPIGFMDYANQTWLNRHHFHDVPTTGVLDWMGLIITSAFFGDGWITLGVIGILAGCIVGAGWLAIGRPRTMGASISGLEALAKSHDYVKIATTLAGAGMLGAIMISTDRLWMFYLFPGALLVTLGSAGALERIATAREALKRPVRVAVLALASLAFGASSYAGVQYLYSDFQDHAARSKSEQFIQQSAMYDALMATADEAALAKAGRTPDGEDPTLVVAFSAHLWNPSSTESIEFLPFYSAFWQWKIGADLVAMRQEHMNRAYQPEPVQERRSTLEAERLLPLHTDIAGPCTLAPCYRLLPPKVEGLFLFARDPKADPIPPAQSPLTSS